MSMPVRCFFLRGGNSGCVVEIQCSSVGSWRWRAEWPHCCHAHRGSRRASRVCPGSGGTSLSARTLSGQHWCRQVSSETNRVIFHWSWLNHDRRFTNNILTEVCWLTEFHLKQNECGPSGDGVAHGKEGDDGAEGQDWVNVLGGRTPLQLTLDGIHRQWGDQGEKDASQIS